MHTCLLIVPFFYDILSLKVSKTTEMKLLTRSPIARGGARHFHLGGPLEGPGLQQGELSMVCVGLSERDLENFWGATVGAVAPLAPP